MPHELIFTSAPVGLKPGASGYCTVARHEEMDVMLERELERISFYEFTRQSHPVIHTFRVLILQSVQFHVLSRILYTGSDHTGRTNYLAHHLVFKESEIYSIAGASPADYFLDPIGWLDEWDASRSPCFFREGEGEKAPFANPSPSNVVVDPQGGVSAPTWEEYTGHGRNAYSPSYRAAGEYRFLTPDGGHDAPLNLLAEFCALPDIGPQWSWRNLTFTTFLQNADSPADFKCIGGTKESAAGQVVRDTLHLPFAPAPDYCFEAASGGPPGPLLPEHPLPVVQEQAQPHGEASADAAQAGAVGVETSPEAMAAEPVYETQSYAHQPRSNRRSIPDPHQSQQVAPQPKKSKLPIVLLAVGLVLVVAGGGVFAYLKLANPDRVEENGDGKDAGEQLRAAEEQKEKEAKEKLQQEAIQAAENLASKTSSALEDAVAALKGANEAVEKAGYSKYEYFKGKLKDGRRIEGVVREAEKNAVEASGRAKETPFQAQKEVAEAQKQNETANAGKKDLDEIVREIAVQLKALKNLQPFILQPHPDDHRVKSVTLHFGPPDRQAKANLSYCEFLDAKSKHPKTWKETGKANLENMAWRLVKDDDGPRAREGMEIHYYFTAMAPVVMVKKSDWPKFPIIDDKSLKPQSSEAHKGFEELVNKNKGILTEKMFWAKQQFPTLKELLDYRYKGESGEQKSKIENLVGDLDLIFKNKEPIQTSVAFDSINEAIDKIGAKKDQSERKKEEEKVKLLNKFKSNVTYRYNEKRKLNPPKYDKKNPLVAKTNEEKYSHYLNELKTDSNPFGVVMKGELIQHILKNKLYSKHKEFEKFYRGKEIKDDKYLTISSDREKTIDEEITALRNKAFEEGKPISEEELKKHKRTKEDESKTRFCNASLEVFKNLQSMGRGVKLKTNQELVDKYRATISYSYEMVKYLQPPNTNTNPFFNLNEDQVYKHYLERLRDDENPFGVEMKDKLFYHIIDERLYLYHDKLSEYYNGREIKDDQLLDIPSNGEREKVINQFIYQKDQDRIKNNEQRLTKEDKERLQKYFENESKTLFCQASLVVFRKLDEFTNDDLFPQLKSFTPGSVALPATDRERQAVVAKLTALKHILDESKKAYSQSKNETIYYSGSVKNVRLKVLP